MTSMLIVVAMMTLPKTVSIPVVLSIGRLTVMMALVVMVIKCVKCVLIGMGTVHVANFTSMEGVVVDLVHGLLHDEVFRLIRVIPVVIVREVLISPVLVIEG